MPKIGKQNETLDEKVNQLVENQNKLLEKLQEETQARKKAEEALEHKEKTEKKEKDPMSGPGEVCQVILITKAEAWQVPNKEVVNPETQTVETKPDMSKVPEGYVVRQGAAYIVKEKHGSRKKYPHELEVIIPNCQSKYTRELTVFTKKAVQDRGNFQKKPPRIKVYLCEKHEKMFGGKLEKNLPADEKENFVRAGV